MQVFARSFLLVCLFSWLFAWTPYSHGALPGGFGGAAGGIGNPFGGGAYVPLTIGGVTPNPPEAVYNTGVGGGGGGTGLGVFSSLLQACSSLLNPGLTGANAGAFGRELEKAAYNGLDGKSEYPEGANQTAWGNLGKQFNSSLSGKCQQKFISKDGKLGQWGLYLYGNLMTHKNQYGIAKPPDPVASRIPRDMGKYCPKFASFSPDARARFYVYLMMVMADPESSCNPTAVGKGPNGAAIGLYQLEKKACDPVGVVGSSQDLLNPEHNMKCAVAVLGKELATRGTITVGTSRGFGGTYWAPLRDDIAARQRSSNAMARGDTKASIKTQDLLKKFSECYSGEDQSNDPNKK